MTETSFCLFIATTSITPPISRLETKTLFYSNFATMRKGLLSGLSWWTECQWESQGWDLFPGCLVSWFTCLLSSGRLRPQSLPLGLKLLKPGSPGSVTPFWSSCLSENWREAPRPFTALPWTGPLHCVRCSWSRWSEGPPDSRRKFQKWALN